MTDEAKQRIAEIERKNGITYKQKIDARKEKIKKEIADLQKLRLCRASENYFGWSIGGFPALSEAFDGIQPGLILLAADTNIGKTTLLTNITYGVLRDNVEAEVLFFTFDDSVEKTYKYFISRISGVPQNKLWSMQEGTPEYESVINAQALLAHYVDNDQLLIELGFSFKEIEETIKDKYWNAIEAGTWSPERKYQPCPFVVVIDGWDYIDVQAKTDQEREGTIAEKTKELVKRFKIPVLCATEIRKDQLQQHINGNDRSKLKKRYLTIDDLGGNRKKKYLSDAVIMLQPTDQMEFNDSSCLIASLDVNIAKNKLGPTKGYTTFKFYKLYTKIEEIGCNEQENYEPGVDSNIDSLHNCIKSDQGGNYDWQAKAAGEKDEDPF
jgi:hypothetical protein